MSVAAMQGDLSLDFAISIEEVRGSLALAKNGKAIGWDSLPVEVLRNETVIGYLHSLFNKCFELGVCPEVWLKSIINPIPKNFSEVFPWFRQFISCMQVS